MKKIAMILAALLLCASLIACAKPAGTETAAESGDLAKVQAAGELVIGITEYEPMNYYDASGKLIGFDTEFAEALCAKLGVTPKFVVIDWQTKELELSTGKIDCIWNGLTVTEERKANMDFTTSYLVNEQCVVIRTADAGKYTDAASLAGAQVVAEGGSAGETAIALDLPDSVYTAVGAQTDGLLEVKAGTADAAVVDITLAIAMTGAGTDYADLQILPSIDMFDEEYAIGLRLGSDLTAKFNELIAALVADGTIAAIAETYGQTDRLIQK